MGPIKKFKIAVRTLGDRLGLHFYARPNRHSVTYRVQVTNNNHQQKNVSLIVPVPSDTNYQTVNELRFSQDPSEQNSDNRGNKYAVWNFEIRPEELKEFSLTFALSIRPRKISCKNGLINDYQHLSNQLKMSSLESNKFIHPHDKEIKQTAEKIIKDAKIDQNDVCAVIKALNQYLIKNLVYGEPIEGLYSSTAALKLDCVDCGGYNTFMIAMCRSLGIPARNVSGFWLGYKKMNHKMHAWMEILLPNGEWMPLDPSSEQLFSQGRMWASGRLGFTGSDRVAMSFGEDILISAGGKQHNIEILQNPIARPNENITLNLKFEEN